MSLIDNGDIDETNMDRNASAQGQRVNSNLPEKNHKIDNEMSQRNMQGNQGDTKSTVCFNTTQSMSAIKACGDSSGDIETGIWTTAEPPVSTPPVRNDEPLVCFELRTDGCVMKTASEKESDMEDKKGEINDNKSDSITPSNQSSSTSPENKISTSGSDDVQDQSKPDTNATFGSSSTTTDSIEVSDDTCLGTQKSNSPKSPDALVDTVQKEVIKLNIREEEPTSEQQPSVTPSKVVVNLQNESFKRLMTYEGGSDSDEQSDTELEVKCPSSPKPEENMPNSKRTWRKTQGDSGTSDSESDSSTSTLSSESESDSDNSNGDSASVIDVSDDGIRTEIPVLNKTSDKGAVKKTSKSVFDFQEYLPPIPDLSNLNINAKEEFMHIGRITAIIAELVTVEAIPGTPAFDLDSMLFVDDQSSKKPIGPIFDVLGPVSEPIYCVRFNSEDEIKKLAIKPGLKVYAAPKSEEFSKFVFVKELMSVKGTDASWLNDHESPQDLADFSDDEQERQARRSEKVGSIKRKLDDSSLERHRRYEKTMNQCNTLNTRVCRLMDAQRNLSRQIRPNPRDDLQHVAAPPGCLELPDVPPEFNPTVPPPGFGHPSPYGYPAHAALFAPSPSAFGQPPGFDAAALASYSPRNGSYTTPPSAVFTGPAQFGSFYANQPPAPHSLAAPPARWQQCDNFRWGRHSQRGGSHRQNSDNYFTNNSRNLRGAGPSYQPF